MAGGVEDGRAEGGEFGEEVREGFADAGWVVEADAGDTEAEHGEAHGDAVIVPCVEGCAVERAGGDGEGVAGFGDEGSAFGEFGAEGEDAFAFLDAETAEVGEFDRVRGERSERDGGHDAVGEVRVARVCGAEGGIEPEGFKGSVGLHAGAWRGGDGDGGSGGSEERLSAPEVAGAGGVGFDLIGAALPWEVEDHASGHVDVGEFVGVGAGDLDEPAGGFGGEDESGGELGAGGDGDGGGCAGARA